ncbi:MAG: hypothetical protein B6I38_10270 [Anaerolineaceae bacterium 4572_5.1]|nr:MAG: hypothetical protein B6I38_10270 [Anaerolineaceae bacterium 4572_5.1]
MDINDIKAKIENGQFRLSLHAEMEAEAENLDIAQIIDAILNDDILEQYSNTGRGESCLVVGFSRGTAIHAVCGYRARYVIIVTVYIPSLPKFIDPWTRAGEK